MFFFAFYDLYVFFVIVGEKSDYHRNISGAA